VRSSRLAACVLCAAPRRVWCGAVLGTGAARVQPHAAPGISRDTRRARLWPGHCTPPPGLATWSRSLSSARGPPWRRTSCQPCSTSSEWRALHARPVLLTTATPAAAAAAVSASLTLRVCGAGAVRSSTAPRDMVAEFERVSMAMSEPGADLDGLTSKMGRLQVRVCVQRSGGRPPPHHHHHTHTHRRVCLVRGPWPVVCALPVLP
jgi:hypothetical protein